MIKMQVKEVLQNPETLQDAPHPIICHEIRVKCLGTRSKPSFWSEDMRIRKQLVVQMDEAVANTDDRLQWRKSALISTSETETRDDDIGNSPLLERIRSIESLLLSGQSETWGI